MKKTQIVAEHWNGEKEVFWFDPLLQNARDILEYASILGFKSVKFNFGTKEKK